jgi:hypothetical protein
MASRSGIRKKRKQIIRLIASRGQVETLKNKAISRKETYEKLMRTVFDFIYNTPKLSGITYNSAKEYAEKIILPIVKGAVLVEDETKSTCQDLIDRYELPFLKETRCLKI